MSKENDAVYLHDNVMTKGRFFGKPTRNWVEELMIARDTVKVLSK